MEENKIQDTIKEIQDTIRSAVEGFKFDFSKKPDLEAYHKAWSDYLNKNVTVIEINIKDE